MTKTKFRCLRRFRTFGVNHVEGEIIELTDDQAAELIWMAGTIEPINKADRRRMVQMPPRIVWEAAPDQDGTRGPAPRSWASSWRPY